MCEKVGHTLLTYQVKTSTNKTNCRTHSTQRVTLVDELPALTLVTVPRSRSAAGAGHAQKLGSESIFCGAESQPLPPIVYIVCFTLWLGGRSVSRQSVADETCARLRVSVRPYDVTAGQ